MDHHAFNFQCRTKTGFGKNALEHLPFDLAGMGAAKPFVLQDTQSSISNSSHSLIRAFRDSDMALGICPPMDRDQEPDMALFKAFYKTFTNKGYDAIIALGTGQVANMAKLLNMAVCLGLDIFKQDPELPGPAAPLLPFAYLPTGAGTGTETAGLASWKGRTFDLPVLAPDMALIDERTLAQETVGNIINASLTSLSVCCEAFVLSKNPLARAYARTGIKMIMDHLFLLLKQPGWTNATFLSPARQDQYHLSALVHASVITGYLLNTCKPLICFDLGQAIARECSSMPGQAMAVLLPSVLAVYDTGTRDLGDLLLPLSSQDEFSAIPLLQKPWAAIEKIQEILNTLYRMSLGVSPRVLAEVGMDQAACARLLERFCAPDNAGSQGRFCSDPDHIKAVLDHSLYGQPFHQGGDHVSTGIL